MLSVFLPHVAEDAYQSNFKRFEDPVSIHVSSWPEAPPKDGSSESEGELVKNIVSSVRAWKSSNGLSLNAELGRLEVVGPDAERLVAGSEEDIRATIKAREIAVLRETSLVEVPGRVRPVHSKLGPRFKKDAKEIVAHIGSRPFGDLEVADEGIIVPMNDGRRLVLSPEFYDVEKRVSSERGELNHLSVGPVSVLVYR
jgi:valyl-tRNA synthetase